MKLPIGYSDPTKYFEIKNGSEDDENAKMKNCVIEKILKKYDVKTVLDLTCGGGSQVFWLLKQGYKVVGADISPAMLKLAKLEAKKEKISLKLIEGDMRTIKVGKFDAVITIFNAVGHLTKAEFEKAMRNIRSNLNDGGLYIFDILNLDCTKNLGGYESTWTVDDTKYRQLQICKLNRKNGHLLTSERYYMQKGPSRPVLFNRYRWTMKIYTAKQLKEMLIKNGFEVLNQYEVDEEKFLVEQNGTSILTIAKKR